MLGWSQEGLLHFLRRTCEPAAMDMLFQALSFVKAMELPAGGPAKDMSVLALVADHALKVAETRKFLAQLCDEPHQPHSQTRRTLADAAQAERTLLATCAACKAQCESCGNMRPPPRPLEPDRLLQPPTML